MSETPLLDTPLDESIEYQAPIEVIHSTYESPGTISNAKDFEESPLLVPGGNGTAHVEVGDDGELVISAKQWFLEDVDEEKGQHLQDLLSPLARLINADMRSRGASGNVAFDITVSDDIAMNDSEIGMTMELSKNTPHTDPGEPFYIGTIGATTLFWEADFQVPVGASKIQRKKAFFEQITEKNLVARVPESGEMSRVEPDGTVHASPNNNPEIKGERRIFFYVLPSQAVTQDQMAA